jgi:hypothetical protein
MTSILKLCVILLSVVGQSVVALAVVVDVLKTTVEQKVFDETVSDQWPIS